MKQNKIPRNEYIRKPVGKTNPYKHDVLYTNLGQWKYPGQVTRIPSNDITMQGVPYPVYGEDDLGYGQMMYPGMDYTFPGQYVTEYPQHKVFETEEDFNKDRLLQIRSKYWPTKNTRPFDTGFDVPITRSGPGPVRMPSVTSDYQGIAMMYGGIPMAQAGIQTESKKIDPIKKYEELLKRDAEIYKKIEEAENTTIFDKIYTGLKNKAKSDYETIKEAGEYVKGLFGGLERKWESMQEEDPRSIAPVIKQDTHKVTTPKTLPSKKTAKTETKQPDISFGYKELYTVPDVNRPKDSLVAFINTFDNDQGAKYYIGHKAKEVTDAGAQKTFNNARAVAHFLRDSDILPGQKITPKEWTVAKGYKYKTTSPGKTVSAVGFDDPEKFRTLYKPNPANDGTYLVKYLKNKELTPEKSKDYSKEGWELDFTVSNQHKFSDIAWDKEGTSTGYAAKSKWLPLKNGKHTYIPYKNKDGFSRFSGGSVVYLFKDPKTGKSIGVDVAGSVNTIKKAGEDIIKKYGIKPQDLELAYHDMGSYSAKPKAHGDKLDYNQWLDYNQYNRGFSGAPLIIPKEEYGGDPSLPDITGHYPFGGQNTKTHTHMSKGGWLDEYQKKGEVREPIYVSDKNDPKLKSYNDSLALYNLSQKAKKLFDANPVDPTLMDYNKKADALASKSKIEPTKLQLSGHAQNYPRDFDPAAMEEPWMVTYKKPVQPYIYKKPEEKEESRTVVYTDKAAFDKAYKAEMDSLNVRKVYDQSFKPGSKTRPLTKEEKEYWKDKKTGLVPNLVEYDPRYPNAGYFGHFKKPVIHNVYKEEPPPPPVKKKDKPKEKGLPPGVIRQWNFNSNVGPVMIYKKGDQEVGREYYRNGKPYETHYGDPTGKTTIDTIPFDPARIKKEGGWLDEYQIRGEVLPSETTQSMIPASVRHQMQMLEKKMPTKQQKENLNKINEKTEGARKAKEMKKQAILEDRKARIADSIEAQKESVIGNPNWRENLARQTQATGDKLRIFPNDADSFIDDYLNPFVMIGDMASGLGQAPYVAKETDSNLPYAFAIGAPLLTGALEGIGGKSTKDFLTNIISPVPFTGEMINKGLNKIGKTAKNASKYFNKKVSATPFKSEIDWSKWNPETPKYPELINEYNTIEESTKKAGTWMKNADGTPYKGSPEQFVQEQSSHFKKAYPQGYDETFRGVGATNTNPDFSKGSDLSYTPPELTGDRSIFTADYDLAKIYAFGEKNPQMLNPFSEKGKPGVFNLIHPKGKQIEINTLFDDWQNVDLRKANKAHLQADLNNKKLHLQKMIDNPYANEKIIEKHKKYIDDLQKNIDEFDSRITDAEELSKLRANIPTVPSTDDIAAYLPKSDLRKVTLRNLIDGAPGDVTIVNNRPGNYLKSRIGNVGFFDMTNPNIYKALVPAAIATGVYQQQEEGGSIGGDDFRRGGLYTPPKIKRKAKKYGTSKNIQSSINKLFTRNYDVFGPGGKNIYNPKAYKTGGWLDFVD